jgi:predicted transcriptional regulator
MLNFLFKGLVKKLERSAKEVSHDFVKSTGKEIGDLFDEKLYPLADNLDYIAEKRIKQAIDDTEKLENKIKADIDSLLAHADEKVRHNLEKIDQVRETAIRDVRETIGQTDIYLENRINQISLAVMQGLNSTKEITNNTLAEINDLEERLSQDANQIVDKIDEAIDGKLELIRNELRRYLAHALPNPFDKCRQRLKIGLKLGARLSDIELYELNECYELSKLNENTSIDEVLKVYGQLQQNAAMMAALVKKSPELKRRAIQDWLKYGVLCEFWHDTMKSYNYTDSLVLEHEKPLRFLTEEVFYE